MALKEKRPGNFWCGVLFHQDNARVYTSSRVLAAIRNAGFKVLHHPSYSPEMTPIEFYFFSILKEFMKNANLLTTNTLYAQKNGQMEQQDQQLFCNGIRAWEKCGTKCIPVAGDYVEK